LPPSFGTSVLEMNGGWLAHASGGPVARSTQTNIGSLLCSLTRF